MLTDRGGCNNCIRNGVACANRVSKLERIYLIEKLGLDPKHLPDGCELGLDGPFIARRERVEGGPDDGNGVWFTSDFIPGERSELEGCERWLEIEITPMPDDITDSYVPGQQDLDSPDDRIMRALYFLYDASLTARDARFTEGGPSIPRHPKYIPANSMQNRCIEYIWGKFVGPKGRRVWRFGGDSLLPIWMLVKRRIDYWPIIRSVEKFEGRWVWIPGLDDYIDGAWSKAKKLKTSEARDLAHDLRIRLKRRINRDTALLRRKEEISFM